MIVVNNQGPPIEAAGSAHAAGNRCAPFIVVMVVVFLLFPGMAFSRDTGAPEALLDAREELNRSDCGIECSTSIAGMYSQRFLDLNKNSIVTTLRSSTDRENDTIILFGINIPQLELEQMSSEEIFAHQILHAGKSVPSEYRFTKSEVIKRKEVSPSEVYVTVRNSGLSADPDLEEEEIIHFILEGDKWKIDP